MINCGDHANRLVDLPELCSELLSRCYQDIRYVNTYSRTGPLFVRYNSEKNNEAALGGQGKGATLF